jgi:alkanesulfonate monooxygenase
MNQPLRFHWSLSQAGNKFRRINDPKELSGLINFSDQLNLCIKAEENGIDSMLMAIGFTRPDPLVLTIVLAQETNKIKFMVAVRSGLITPAYYVQQLNTASTIIGDRIHINVVGGHTPAELRYYGDFLDHDERYQRTGEFLDICHKFWEDDGAANFSGTFYQVQNGIIATPFNSPKGRPEIYIGGNSQQCSDLVCSYGDCLWRFPETPEQTIEKTKAVLAAGKEVGFIAAIIVRPTQEEAENAAKELLKNFTGNNKDVHKENYKRFDSVGFKEVLDKAFNNESAWITPYLWNGAVPFLGAPSIAFVGSYENIANALINYKKIGVTQFLFMGWPDEEEIVHFGQGVLPIIRKMEMEETTGVKLKTSL